MNRDEINRRLIGVMEEASVEGFDAGTVAETTPLESFGVDSLVMIDLIFDLEQEFGVKMRAEELTSLATVGDLLTFLEERVDR